MHFELSENVDALNFQTILVSGYPVSLPLKQKLSESVHTEAYEYIERPVQQVHCLVCGRPCSPPIIRHDGRLFLLADKSIQVYLPQLPDFFLWLKDLKCHIDTEISRLGQCQCDVPRVRLFFESPVHSQLPDLREYYYPRFVSDAYRYSYR